VSSTPTGTLQRGQRERLEIVVGAGRGVRARGVAERVDDRVGMRRAQADGDRQARAAACGRLVADVVEDHRAEAESGVAEQIRAHERAQRVTEEVRLRELESIHHAQHVARHVAVAIARLLVRRVASTVSAAVERDHASDRAQRVDPAGRRPALLQVRAPAAREHDRSSGAEAPLVDLQTLGLDEAHARDATGPTAGARSGSERI